MTNSTELIARIHVNVHEVRLNNPAISIRVFDPNTGDEVGVYRCRSLRASGPSRILQVKPGDALYAGAKVWSEMALADIITVDGGEPPWL